MTNAQLRLTVLEAWGAIRVASTTSDLCEKALAECDRIEREHRGMGRRFLSGITTPRYALSVEMTARYFVAKLTSEAHKVPKTWKEFTGYRADFPLCQALREEIKTAGKGAALIRSAAFKAIDYAGDIALKV